MVAAANRDVGYFGKRLTGLVDAPFTGIDEAREDQRLCALAAFGKAAIDEKLIGAALDQAKVFAKPELAARRRRGRARRAQSSRCAWR
jgi:hypothetical protein